MCEFGGVCGGICKFDELSIDPNCCWIIGCGVGCLCEWFDGGPLLQPFIKLPPLLFWLFKLQYGDVIFL